jgi:hypothetical protein
MRQPYKELSTEEILIRRFGIKTFQKTIKANIKREIEKLDRTHDRLDRTPRKLIILD